MFLDYPWMSSLLIVLLVPLMLVIMYFFERRTRIWAYYVAAILMGAFAIYQLYANLSARLDFFSSAACLVIDFIAATACVGAAILERQKIIEESQVQLQDIDQPLSTQTSNEQKETAPLLVNQEKASEELAAIRDIENKIAEKNTKLQQEQNATNEAVQEWFNEQIVYFESDIQLALRNCAKLFVQTGKIEIEQEKIPPCDTRYKHTDFLRICAIFLLAGRSRVQCANFTNTVFHSYFHGTTLKSIHRKLWGKEKMRKILLECQQSK